MARRNRNYDGKKHGFGGAVTDGIVKINRLCRNVLAQTCRLQSTPDEIIAMVMKPEVAAILRAAYPYAHLRKETVAIGLPRDPNAVFLNFPTECNEFKILDADEKYFEWQPCAAAFLAKAEKSFNTVQKFSLAAYMLRWFDENATMAATRFYFPQAMALMPALDWGDGSGKFATPKGIGQFLAAIRESAVTLSSAMLASEASSLVPTSVSINYGSYRAFDYKFGDSTESVPYLGVNHPVYLEDYED